MHEIPATNSFAEELTDEQLLHNYRDSGDRELFARLVRRYERELYAYLRRYLGNAEMAEDVFQSTFLQVHLKCDKFDTSRRFKPWLYTVATNQAIDAQRRNKRHRMVSLNRTNQNDDSVDVGALIDLMVSKDTGPLDHVSQLERGQWVQNAISQLSDQMRSVVNLVYYEGMKYREAADILDIPVGTVKSRLHAAILKLNEAWIASHDETEF
ncbi:MAG TPA: RNA polymerase subunit sigma-70 [Planctomycetaceae bacterium]|jgi:RNA polymerase sigma-70 factor (ECF subfamily)|nr:RNA polymerase subunit sigma-70 [Rhodopirellula sp.]MCH2362366.1 RNA polymerase sigma factor [Pirellulales bacterium]HAL14433.1 RNA polymerase subunit sigma-70 [Planctomycetaceae bacterium]MBE76086.1 RNA polymerase subunit sigma-70 [Rhodopirellula sp.]HCK72269.1 RNA polymerase subunit sigma-70 [Planctomycetaceae bacterium]|tara:strand:+ start:233 stop:865 length:633 start_codon:yes stop_codon:yes gene_type:complete